MFHFNFKKNFFIFCINERDNRCNISVLNVHCFHFEYISKKSTYN